jgi:hypothetical protein
LRNGTIRIAPEDIAQLLARVGPSASGVASRIAFPSIYDIPQAIEVAYDSIRDVLALTFQYINMEPIGRLKAIDERVTVSLGKETNKLLKVEFSRFLKERVNVEINLKEAVEDRRSNHSIVRQLVAQKAAQLKTMAAS